MKGVDFDSVTNTCFELRSINSALLTPNPGVTHYQKTDCPRELCGEGSRGIQRVQGLDAGVDVWIVQEQIQA